MASLVLRAASNRSQPVAPLAYGERPRRECYPSGKFGISHDGRHEVRQGHEHQLPGAVQVQRTEQSQEQRIPCADQLRQVGHGPGEGLWASGGGPEPTDQVGGFLKDEVVTFCDHLPRRGPLARRIIDALNEPICLCQAFRA